MNIKYIDSYFKNRFKAGYAVPTPVIKNYYEELVDDVISTPDEIEIYDEHFRELCRHFIVEGDLSYVLYNKVEQELLELTERDISDFYDIPTKHDVDESILNLPDEGKIKTIIDDFLFDFDYGEICSIEELNEYVVSYMRDMNTPSFGRLNYKQPLLAPAIIRNLHETDAGSGYWEIRRVENKINSGIEIDISSALKFKKKKSEDKFKFKLSEDELSKNNVFLEKWSRYRIPRHIMVGKMPELLSNMAQFALLSSDDIVSQDDKEKLIYGLANKLGEKYDDDDFIDNVNEMMKYI